MIATIGRVDRSHQETCHLLMADDMKLVQHEQWEFEVCHLKNDEQIGTFQSDGKRTFYIKKSIIDLYAERQDHSSQLSLFQFIKKWKVIHRYGDSRLQLREAKAEQKLVVDWRPILSAKRTSTRYHEFCGQELIKCKPCRGEMSEAWNSEKSFPRKDESHGDHRFGSVSN